MISALLFGFGQRLDAPPLELGLLQHRGDQFAFAAHDFGLLHLDLVLLLDLVNRHFLGAHLLLHDVGLDFVGLVGLRLLLLDRLQVLGLLDFEVALRFGLLGLRSVSASTRSWSACALATAASRDASARLIAVSRSASAAATSASRLMRATSGRPMLVMYSFLSRTSLIVNEITSRPILFMSSAQVHAHALAHHLRLLHDLFHRELADDAAQVAFHHQADQRLRAPPAAW